MNAPPQEYHRNSARGAVVKDSHDLGTVVGGDSEREEAGGRRGAGGEEQQQQYRDEDFLSAEELWATFANSGPS